MRSPTAAIHKGLAEEIFVVVVKKDGRITETRAYLSGSGAVSAIKQLENRGFECDYWGSRIRGFTKLRH